MKQLETKEASRKLRDGEVLIAALDSMLALICDARNDDAVQLLRKLKNRTPDKGFTILMDSDARINRYIPDVPSLAWDIFDTSAESPVILILPKGQQISKHALAEDGSVAVRKTVSEEEQKLVQTANSPIACTALLTSEGAPAKRLEDADPVVLDALDYVLSLPTAKSQYIASPIPVVKLGMDGEVKIIRG